MTCHVSSYIELVIASSSTHSEMCNKLICIDDMDECHCATSINVIMNILHQEARYSMVY